VSDLSIEEGWPFRWRVVPSQQWMEKMAARIGLLTAKDVQAMSDAEMFCAEYFFQVERCNALEESHGPEVYIPRQVAQEPEPDVDEWAIPHESDA